MNHEGRAHLDRDLSAEAVYASQLESGVDIRTYDVSMMHAKVITVDGVDATVGSANMNQRSGIVSSWL